MSKKRNGFTLIELIIVVVIIGILSGVALNVINIRKVQERSRDARRIGDIKKIQTALELYFADTRGYPLSASWVKITNPAPAALSSLSTYIDKFPVDPFDTQTSNDAALSCRGERIHGYYYISDANGGKYLLNMIMETTENAKGSLCSSLSNCQGSPSAINCSNILGSYCYCVQNPL